MEMEKLNNGITSVNYITSWKMISEKIEQILHSEAKAVMSFEPLYSQVYKNVCYGFSEQMHLDLISLCSKHLHNINQKLCSNNEFSVEHLLKVHHYLRTYLLSAKIISSVFSYLNKFYVTYYLNADLFMQLANLFTQIILSERIATLMGVVEESLKIPFSISPGVLHNFFNQLHLISNGEYSNKYLHLFSRYCPSVLPPMKESEIEHHITEIFEFSQKAANSHNFIGDRHGIKRPAEEPDTRPSYHYQLQKTYPIFY